MRGRPGASGPGSRWAVVGLAAALAILAPAAGAATFVADDVSPGADAAPGDGICATAGGSCTLQAAVEEANALAGRDEVRLPTGDYSGPALAIAGDLDVAGAGPSATRLFSALEVDAGQVTLRGFIVNGLEVLGSTTDVLFESCESQSIVMHAGTLVVRRSAVRGGEGVFHDGGSLSLVETEITDNRPTTRTEGGGVYSTAGIVELERCTIAGNRLDVIDGPSAWNGVRGGGLSLVAGDLTNCTIDSNTASIEGESVWAAAGGIFMAAGSIRNCTITRNAARSWAPYRGSSSSAMDGGMWIDPAVTVSNTIVWGNTVYGAGWSTAGDIWPDTERVTSAGYTIVGDPTCEITGPGPDLVGVDPRVGPLGAHGGAVRTCPLLPGSVAIDFGSPDPVGSTPASCLPTDARNMRRWQGAGCDAGAYEACPDAVDSDEDGIGDACDDCASAADPLQDLPDADGDGHPDACDDCASVADPLQDLPDLDADGIADSCDDCPGEPDPTQPDGDGDLRGDACDPCPLEVLGTGADADADGMSDACDDCPLSSDPGQPDGDRDGVGDACDLCPAIPSTDNADPDADAIGTACDNCPSVANVTQADGDGDGIGDACAADPCPEPSALDVDPMVRPLLVARLDASTLIASWEFRSTLAAEVHQGTLASLRSGGDHASVACDVTAAGIRLPLPPADSYFLVGWRCGGSRGSLGRDSFGTERAPGRNPCP